MRHRWTEWEVEYMTKHADEGAEAIAEALGRSVKSVENAASRYRVSLRKRWFCPRCSRYTYTPLSNTWGFCRACCIEESHDRAAEKHQQVMKEIKAEKARILRAERGRQVIYSETERRRRDLCKLRAERERKENRLKAC